MTNEVKKLKEMHKKRRERKAKIRKTIVVAISTMTITMGMVVIGIKVNATTVKEVIAKHSNDNNEVVEDCLNTIQELRSLGIQELQIKKYVINKYGNAGSLIYQNEDYYIKNK